MVTADVARADAGRSTELSQGIRYLQEQTMNLTSLLTAAVTCGVFVVAVYRRLCRFSERTCSDVLPFLHKIDLEVLYGTFHPEAEETLREQLSPKEFKRLQWKRFLLGIHLC